MPFFRTPAHCDLCHFPVQTGEAIIPIGKSQCHRFCALTQFALGVPGAWIELQQALRPVLPVHDPPYREHALQILKASCQPTILSVTVGNPCQNQGDCDCLKCFFGRLAKLPVELFTTILLMTGPSAIAKLLVILGETSKLNVALKNRQQHPVSVMCQGNVFQTSIEFGGKSYVTGLHGQMVPYSKRIKSKDEPCNLLVAWSDRIGVTKVEFLVTNDYASGKKPSSVKDTYDQSLIDGTLIECRNCVLLNAKHQPAIQSKREWASALAVAKTPVHLRYKGIFLEKISFSSHDWSQTYWDCSKASVLFLREILPARPRQDLLLRYVPLQNLCAITFAFASGRLVGVLSHASLNRIVCFYEELSSDILCLLCPMSDGERIEAIWIISHRDRNINLGPRSVIVKTQMKTVWLSSYMSPVEQPNYKIDLCADKHATALYHNDFRLPYSIVAAEPPPCCKASSDHTLTPSFQAYQTPNPGFETFQYNMYYSEAPLTALVKIQACMDGDYCVGLLLDYGSHSMTVGQYRYDKDISVPYNPGSVRLHQEEDVLKKPRTRLRTFGEGPVQNMTNDGSMGLTDGIIVWWYSRDASVANVLT